MLTNKICARHILTFKNPYLPFHYYICRPWTSLGSTVFTQIVSSYNYERLIRSISTPFCLHNICTHYLYLYSYAPLFLRPLLFIPSIRTPSFLPLYLCPLYLYALFVLIFVHLYFYAFILTSSLTTLSLPTPTTLPFICIHNIYAFLRTYLLFIILIKFAY